MENLDTALASKKLEDLEPVSTAVQSNLIEPTVAEIEAILTSLKEGKSYGEIKKTVRRVIEKEGKQTSAQGFSFGQIKEIDMARLNKLNELTPKEDVEISE